MRGYMADRGKRLIGAMIVGFTSIVVFSIPAIGVGRSCLALLRWHSAPDPNLVPWGSMSYARLGDWLNLGDMRHACTNAVDGDSWGRLREPGH